MQPKDLRFVMVRHDDEDGVYFVIEGVEIALVAEGATIDEALRNLREAVELYYEGDELSHFPRLELTFEVTEAYA
jgi:predicted RNase H-like HicB family nuclease